MVVRQLRSDNVDHLSRSIFGDKTKTKHPRRLDPGMGMKNTCAKVKGLSHKNRVDRLTVLRVNEQFTLFPSNDFVFV